MKSSHIGLLMFWIPPTPRSDRRTTGRSGRARERDETNKGSTCSNETKKTPAATQQRKHLRQRNKKRKRRRQQNKENTCGNETNNASAATQPTKHLRPTNQTKHNGWCHHLCVCLSVCLFCLFCLSSRNTLLGQPKYLLNKPRAYRFPDLPTIPTNHRI